MDEGHPQAESLSHCKNAPTYGVVAAIHLNTAVILMAQASRQPAPLSQCVAWVSGSRQSWRLERSGIGKNGHNNFAPGCYLWPSKKFGGMEATGEKRI